MEGVYVLTSTALVVLIVALSFQSPLSEQESKKNTKIWCEAPVSVPGASIVCYELNNDTTCNLGLGTGAVGTARQTTRQSKSFRLDYWQYYYCVY